MNRRINIIFAAIIFLLNVFIVRAQITKVDSLLKIWHSNSNADTSRCNALLAVSQFYQDKKPDSAIYYGEVLLKEVKKISDQKRIADASFSIAWAYFRKGENTKAFPLLNQAVTIYEKLNNDLGMAQAYNAMGGLFSMQKDSLKSAEYYQKALKVYERTNNKKGIATVLSNLAAGKASDRNISYLSRSLDLFREIGDKKGEATVLFKIAQDKMETSKSKEVPVEFFECLKTFDQMNNMVWVSYLYSSIAAIYFEKGEYKRSIENAKKGYEIALKHDLSKEKMDNLNVLVEACNKANDHKNAFNYFRILVNERDSVNNIQVNNSILKQEMESNYEREKALEKKEQEKEMAVVKAKEEQQKFLSYGIAAVLVLVIAFSAIIAKRLNLTKKQNRIIQEQRIQTEKQKEIIEEKQKEVIDSINYAKRLQQAILPPESFLKEHFPNAFVYYKPKAIVAGDFYWVEAVSPLHVGSDLIFVAVADCTGHGVPGAIVSMVCHNALNRALLEFQITDPGKILNIVRELIISTFEKSEGDVKDGMDISLCCFNTTKNELTWAGANNPLWILKKGEEVIVQTHPNKQPIGKVDQPKPFDTHKIDLNSGDTVYLFSDGFADQFGGPKGKKYKYKQLNEFIVTHKELTMEEQKLLLENEFEKWKGGLEQTDDVCIIGIRI